MTNLKDNIVKILKDAYDRPYSEWGDGYHDSVTEEILDELNKSMKRDPFYS